MFLVIKLFHLISFYLNNNTLRLIQRKISEGEKFEKDLHHGHHITQWKKKLEDIQLELQGLRRMV